MPKYNLATGLAVSQVHTPEEKAALRVKRMRVAVWCAVEGLRAAQQGGKVRLIMFTLTYKGVKSWAPRSVANFGRWLNAHGSDGYVWVAELQKRGAVHYHVLSTWPLGKPWIKPSPETGGWTRGFTWVTDEIKYPWYLMKYIQKGTKDGRTIRYPKGLRIYSVSRRTVRHMPDSVRDIYGGIHLPSWYREGAAVAGRLGGSRRVTGGILRGTFVYLSPYAQRIPILTTAVEMSMWYNFHSGIYQPAQ